MPRVGGGTAEHFRVGNDADRTFLIDRIGSHEELARLAMDHAVRRSAADRLRPDGEDESGRDFVEFVRRALRHVWGVGQSPEFARPRHNRPGAAFAFVVKKGEMGVDPTPLVSGVYGKRYRRNKERDDQGKAGGGFHSVEKAGTKLGSQKSGSLDRHSIRFQPIPGVGRLADFSDLNPKNNALPSYPYNGNY
jgi:hypothetical protein